MNGCTVYTHNSLPDDVFPFHSLHFNRFKCVVAIGIQIASSFRWNCEQETGNFCSNRMNFSVCFVPINTQTYTKCDCTVAHTHTLRIQYTRIKREREREVRFKTITILDYGIHFLCNWPRISNFNFVNSIW